MTRRPAVLDWREPVHFERNRGRVILRACRACGRPTPLRDDRGQPSHKVCAERGLS